MEGPKRPRHKTGVVYLPQIPRFMTAGQAKMYFSKFGFPIGRVFFVPETAEQRFARKRRGGDVRRKLYLEGWIEFLRKRDAKTVVETFNGRPVEGNASYKNSLWNLRYLSGFKFDHLQEEEVYKKARKDQQVRQGLADAKKETQAYLDKVERAERIERAKNRKRQAGEHVEEEGVRLRWQVAMADEKDDAEKELVKALVPHGEEKKQKKRK